MAKHFERLNYLVEQGEEIAPLSSSDALTFGFEKFVDEVFILKARLIFHIIAIKCNSKGSEFVNSILGGLEKKDSKITTEYVFKTISKKHSLRDKDFKKQFIENTGIPHFAFQYEDSRKENKVYYFAAWSVVVTILVSRYLSKWLRRLFRRNISGTITITAMN